MRRIKSYTGIWGVEKVFYGINDITLPRPITLTQIVWGLIFFILSLLLKGIPPFVFKDSVLMNHIAIPIFMAWIISRKSFDGKKPLSFIKSIVGYVMRSKVNCRGKTVNLRVKKIENEKICIGRRKEHVVSD